MRCPYIFPLSQIVKDSFCFTLRNGGLDYFIKVIGMGFLSSLWEEGREICSGHHFSYDFFSSFVTSTLYTSWHQGFVLWKMAPTSTTVFSDVCTEHWVLLHKFTKMIWVSFFSPLNLSESLVVWYHLLKSPWVYKFITFCITLLSFQHAWGTREICMLGCHS